jgi:2-dehydro-3-deoxyphosphogluconate aldolase/(4S)-4-hydroxy-2-oxoglutarate aldolase
MENDNRQACIEKIKKIGVVAVIRGKTADDAVRMTEALIKGGVLGLEITFTTPDCVQALKRIRAIAPPEASIGVGTVRSAEQLQQAAEAGAEFAVSPHFEPEVLVAALEARIPYIPGCLTPTEVSQAWENGAAAIKIFPASSFGPDFIKAVRTVFPEIPLMPTGGVSLANMQQWFNAGAFAVGMGGNLVTGTSEAIEAEAKKARAELARIREAKN